MIMKRFLNILGIITLSLSIFSCDTEELLNKTPPTKLSGDSYNSEANIQAGLFAVYDVLQWQAMDGTHMFPAMFQSIRSDDMSAQQANYWSLGVPFDDFEKMDASNVSVQRLWQKYYAGVSRANLIVDKAEAFDGYTTEGLKEQLVAEGKVLRAFFYFELARMFGGVPLIVNAVESTEDIPVLNRASISEIYAQVDKDLTEAIPHLPKKSETDEGRVTSGLAQTLLAKSKMYQNDYSACAKYCEDVINSNEYVLETDFAANFSLDSENGTESVLEIQYGDGFTSDYFENANTFSQGSAMWQMCFMWAGGIYTSFGNMLPRGELKALYTEGDVRKDATFISAGTVLNSPGLADMGWDPVPAAGLGGFWVAEEDRNMSRKYFLTFEQVAPLLEKSQSPLNEKVIRYAEVLLMHAEARVMGGSGSIDGLSSINAVRERAGLETLSSYTMDDVKLERRLELATEGWNRFSDVVRWGDAATNARFIEKNFTAGRDELLPIPQAEIDAVGAGVLEQNPGY